MILNLRTGLPESITNSSDVFSTELIDSDYDECYSKELYEVEFCPLLAMPFTLYSGMVIAVDGTPEGILLPALKSLGIECPSIKWRSIETAFTN